MIKYRRCKIEYIICDDCGAKFKPGNRPDGIPNGMSFIDGQGKHVDVCAKCIINYGRQAKQEDK